MEKDLFIHTHDLSFHKQNLNIITIKGPVIIYVGGGGGGRKMLACQIFCVPPLGYTSNY